MVWPQVAHTGLLGLLGLLGLFGLLRLLRLFDSLGARDVISGLEETGLFGLLWLSELLCLERARVRRENVEEEEEEEEDLSAANPLLGLVGSLG